MPIERTWKPVVAGEQLDVFFICDTNEKFLAEEFLKGKRANQRECRQCANIVGTLARLAKIGVVRNEEKFKLLEDGIYEAKAFQLRILGFFERSPNERQAFYLPHGFTKKSRKTPKNEIEKAKRIRAEWLSRMEKK